MKKSRNFIQSIFEWNAYKRELTKNAFAFESSNQETERHNIESQKKFVLEATKTSTKSEAIHKVHFKDFKVRENSSVYIPVG